MRLHALQYLRAVAALVVVYHHATLQHPPYADLLPGFGAFGVDVFFVISGFIMVWIARPTDTPGRFLVNRVRRVVPLYWFFTLLMGAVLLLAPGAFRNTAFDPMVLLKSLAFLPHESAAHPGELWPVLAPGWSLNYEMYFYLLFTLSLLVAMRYRVALITTIIVAVLSTAALAGAGLDVGVTEAGGGSRGVLISFFSESIVLEFVLGMAIAIAYRRGLRLSPLTGTLLVVLGACLLLLDLPIAHILRFGVPAALVVLGSLYLRLPEWRPGVLLGDASYALYLSHVFVLGALRAVLPDRLDALFGAGPVAAWSFVVIALLISSLVSVFVHAVIDNRLLRQDWLVGWWRARRDGAGARATRYERVSRS